MADAPELPPQQTGAQLVDVDLETPIVRGEVTIASIKLQRPKAGAMRGLQMQPLMQGDVNALLSLIPRIAIPPITQSEAEDLDAIDIAAIGGAVYGFFMSKQEREAMTKFIGAIDQELSNS